MAKCSQPLSYGRRRAIHLTSIRNHDFSRSHAKLSVSLTIYNNTIYFSFILSPDLRECSVRGLSLCCYSLTTPTTRLQRAKKVARRASQKIVVIWIATICIVNDKRSLFRSGMHTSTWSPCSRARVRLFALTPDEADSLAIAVDK